MRYIEWEDRYSVSILFIDEHHKTLFYIINDIYDQIKDKPVPDKNLLLKDIKRLIEYAYFHFLSEEKQMLQLNYEGYAAHKAEHDAFANRVKEWKERLENDKLLLYVELTNYLKRWLIDHILDSDKKYTKLFVANGLK